MEILNKYYIRVNDENKVIKTFSDVFEENLEGDILVGEGGGSQFVISEKVLSLELKKYANIENGLPLVSDEGIYQLRYENNIISKLSDEEIQKEISKLPLPRPSEIEALEKENLLLMETTTQLFEKTLELEKQNIDLMIAITEIYENIV